MPFVPGSLIIHLGVASFVGLVWSAASIWLLRIRRPATRALLFAGALIAPAVGFLAHLVIRHECSGYGSAGHWAHLACLTGSWLGDAGALLVASGLIVVVSQSIVSWWAYRRVLHGAQTVRFEDSSRPGGAFERVEAALRNVCAKAGVAVPRLIVTDLRGVCCVIGVLRPVLVISRDLSETLDRDELEAVFAHEVAHVVRRDNAVGLVAGLLRALAFFSPAVHITMKMYMSEREKAADDLAVSFTGDGIALASSIVKVWRVQGASLDQVHHLVAGSAATHSSVASRIERLLVQEDDPYVRRLPVAFIGGAGLLLAILLLC